MNISRTSQADYAYLSKSRLERGLCCNWNLYIPDWNRALVAAYCAKTTYDAIRCTYSGGVDNVDDASSQSRVLRDDHLYSLIGDFHLADAVTLRTHVYHHENTGHGHWGAPGQISNPGKPQELPISIRIVVPTIRSIALEALLRWSGI